MQNTVIMHICITDSVHRNVHRSVSLQSDIANCWPGMHSFMDLCEQGTFWKHCCVYEKLFKKNTQRKNVSVFSASLSWNVPLLRKGSSNRHLKWLLKKHNSYFSVTFRGGRSDITCIVSLKWTIAIKCYPMFTWWCLILWVLQTL